MLDLEKQREYLGGRIEKAIEGVLRHGHFVGGKEIELFESWLVEHTDFEFAIGVSSGTDALIIALMADGVKAGDAVFLPSFTYVATAEIVILLGATPVFVDVDPETYQISAQDLKEKIKLTIKLGKLRPVAIIGVDLFGQPAPWSELVDIAKTYRLNLYADSAQSFGATYNNKTSGKLARATILSFFPAKPLGAYGDGGAILTDSVDLVEKYRSIRSHGMGENPYDIIRVGLNARLDSLQAAILLAKTVSFEEECQKRQRNVELYNKFLPSIYRRPSCSTNGKGAWSVYTILLPKWMDRKKCSQYLSQANIQHAIYYEKPLHLQDAYKKFHDKSSSLIVSETLSKHVLALPVHAYLAQNELDKVILILEEFSKQESPL
ncbi:DegT/DnrJ/EryC1/StrS aminotransferase family protein [Acetobacteraceae bacterium]|nr:DegT/DnrJ/EryC1/StrS aminotransferase family protein [Acetobacteraceae bacterium]